MTHNSHLLVGALLLSLAGCPGEKESGASMERGSDAETASEDTASGGTFRTDLPGVPTGCDSVWYPDADGDGFGDGSAPMVACARPRGTLADGSDCDDANAAVYPGASEVCGDGEVNDCDYASGDVAAAACQREGSLADADVKLLGEAENEVGYGLAGVGDINGDGKDDLLLGAEGSEGHVAYLVLGAPSGTVSLADADARLTAEADTEYSGWDVAGPGDVDGDGTPDLLVSSAWTRTAGGALTPGVAHLVLGPVAGELDLGSADAKIGGDDDGDFAGGVAGPGDVDGDGFDDVLIPVPYAQNAEGDYSGRVYLVRGPVPAARALADADATVVMEDSYVGPGVAVTRCGDLDGDGTADLFIGAEFDSEGGYDAGAAYIVLGPVSGEVSLGDADGKLVGEARDSYAGGVAGAGDVNGDGTPDLLVRAPTDIYTYDEWQSKIYLVSGPGRGHRSLADADASFVGESRYQDLGSMSSAGDLDVDGYGDLVINSNDATVGGDEVGADYVLRGPLAGSHTLDAADAKFAGSLGARAIGNVSGVGDVDADGLPDLLTGEPDDETADSSSAVYLLLGSGPLLSGNYGP